LVDFFGEALNEIPVFGRSGTGDALQAPGDVGGMCAEMRRREGRSGQTG
jgi:hypothetical protein